MLANQIKMAEVQAKYGLQATELAQSAAQHAQEMAASNGTGQEETR
jgi:hypothetical protein